MCPIVPTFTCGLVRINFCFAISAPPLASSRQPLAVALVFLLLIGG